MICVILNQSTNFFVVILCILEMQELYHHKVVSRDLKYRLQHNLMIIIALSGVFAGISLVQYLPHQVMMVVFDFGNVSDNFLTETFIYSFCCTGLMMGVLNKRLHFMIKYDFVKHFSFNCCSIKPIYFLQKGKNILSGKVFKLGISQLHKQHNIIVPLCYIFPY